MYSLNELTTSSASNLYTRAKSLIPGGTQLLSKRPEMFAPEVWPAYFSRAKGYRVWDLDDREFLDMSTMSVGASILGYSDPDVDECVVKAIQDGTCCSLNASEEVKLAEMLINIHPWFDMVRYARSGGEAMSVAVRIARAHTKREKVFFSGYHGWCDWYLAANLGNVDSLDGQLLPGLHPNGVPNSLKGSSIPFFPNSISSLREKIKGSENEIAAIVIEPARGVDAPSGYLSDLSDLASEIGAILIFDEITSGFRVCVGGIHRKYLVHPHIAVFAKSLSNGYPMAAICGVESVMQAAQTSFISSTNWTERIGPVAALATLEKYINCSVDQHIVALGNYVKSRLIEISKFHGLHITTSGLPSLLSFDFQYSNSVEMDTLFTIEMLKRGFLACRQFKPSYAHDDYVINQYLIAADEVFGIIKADLACTTLQTPLRHTGFARLTKD